MTTSTTERKKAQAVALIASGMKVSAAARELELDRSTLHRWMRETPAAFKVPASEATLRAKLTAALDAKLSDGRPDHRTQREAAEKLHELDARRTTASGPGVVRVYMSDPGEH